MVYGPDLKNLFGERAVNFYLRRLARDERRRGEHEETRERDRNPLHVERSAETCWTSGGMIKAKFKRQKAKMEDGGQRGSRLSLLIFAFCLLPLAFRVVAGATLRAIIALQAANKNRVGTGARSDSL